jgi:isoamyl acetate esterase
MPTLPKVLLLGDSIRMSYQSQVAKALEEVAEVVGPADNCQYSLFTLSSLGRWLTELGQPVVVHWNNGLHDIGHNPNRAPIQMPLQVYRDNLGHILRHLRTITPHIIWATNTPVHPDRPFRDDQWSWRNEEIDRYNQAALELMEVEKVPVNDLHALVHRDLDGYLAEDQLHLSTAGQAACAAAVAQTVKGHMPEN